MSTIGVQISAAGIVAPDYNDILAQLRSQFWSIYGTDANLDDDTQDGQFLSIVALAIYNVNQLAVAVYNSFSPSTAQGAGLSSVVKISGIARHVPSNSESVVTMIGQVGVTVLGGIVGDRLGLNTRWNLPPSVTFPDSGTIDVTATCEAEGAVTAAAGTLTVILTPTRGWQSVTNAAEAAPGLPVESDAALRQRQSQSTSIPAQSVVDAIYGSVAAVSGVSRLQIYENSTDATDDNSIPSHSISAVVLGGDIDTIAQTMARNKTPGTGTYGDVSVLVLDSRGVPSTISFNELSLVPITVEIDIDALPGYTTAIGVEIAAAVAAYVSGLAIGEDSYLSRLFAAAALGGSGDGGTFVVSAIRQARDGDMPSAANVTIDFDEAATCVVADITVTPTV